jgi:hypothetical protein
VNKPRTIEGKWWIDGDDKPPQFGILSFDPEKGFDLAVKIPQARNDEGWMALFQSQAKDDESQKTIPSIIHGADKNDHPITLFGVGAINKNATSGLDTHCYGSIQCAILNYRGQYFDEARFPIACVNYTLLTKWMNRRLHLDSCKVEDETADHFISIKFKSHEIFEFDVMPGVRLRIEGNTLRDRSSDELRLEWLYHAWFLFDKPVDARTILDKYTSVFLRLLCLLTGEGVFIDELFFWDGDPFKPAQGRIPQGFELLMPNKGITEAKRDCFAPFMIANFDEIAADFSSNYYTHYDQELWQSGKVAKGLELRRIMYVLHGLLQVCLLKELGIEGKPIERILERNNSIKWADLQTEAKS